MVKSFVLITSFPVKSLILTKTSLTLIGVSMVIKLLAGLGKIWIDEVVLVLFSTDNLV